MDVDAGARAAGISAREAEVLAALGEHLTNAEIGARLFISVRTVESHVSSLRRKLQATDRRALSIAAHTRQPDPTRESTAAVTITSLPSSLTPFVGRSAERAALTAAVGEHRLVTAVGPGGIGKTRLALAVATDLRERFADGVWYIDLVPITDPDMIAPTIAEALGLGESRGSTAMDDLLRWLAGRQALLVLDNCEHLLDSVAVLLERLLAGCGRVAVLATSRARLLAPFEWVFAVPGLSVDTVVDGRGDAVELFLGRAAAAGSPVRADDPATTKRVAELCRSLDGMALAIELAAARYPSVGLDGLESGLADRLRLLRGGRRVDDRHRSLRSALDWSYALLDDPGRAVLRRVSVFADAFTASAAATVLADWPPISTADVPTVLANLADQSLLVSVAGPNGTRYRALETIRQYGADRLADADEPIEARERHLRWCQSERAALEQVAYDDIAWRAAFDDVADELRAALTWALAQARYRVQAHRLASGLAQLCFLRGMLGEAQRRYEQAAELAADDVAAAQELRSAAGIAESRYSIDDCVRLRRLAVEAALRAGDRAGAAGDLAANAEMINRVACELAVGPVDDEVDELIARGRVLAGDDLQAQARLLCAEAFTLDPAEPAALGLAEPALAMARQVADPLIESAVLDQLTCIQLTRGDVRAAADTTRRRIELLAPVRVTAITGPEFFDAFVMASDCAVAAGALSDARQYSEHLRDLPFFREEGHLAATRLLVVTALAGELGEAAVLAERFRDGWERAGRPQLGSLCRGAYAAATVHGLRGDDATRADWLAVCAELEVPGRPIADLQFGKCFDALLLLHRGQLAEAVRGLDVSPDRLNQWQSGMWRPWYAALWAEAAVLSGDADSAARLEIARPDVAGNPIATAILDRATALLSAGVDRDALRAAATALHDAGCRYQWARTLVMLGGDDRRHGESVLATAGATPMAWLPE